MRKISVHIFGIKKEHSSPKDEGGLKKRFMTKFKTLIIFLDPADRMFDSAEPAYHSFVPAYQILPHLR